MKVPKKSLLCSGFLLAFASMASAQLAETEDLHVKRVKSVQQFGYDAHEGRVIKSAPQKRAVAQFCFVNTDTSGFFTTPDANAQETMVDFGVVGGINTTLCSGLSPIIQEFNFAYATSAVDTSVGGPGANITLKFYAGYDGFGADSGNCPVATFTFTGLPAFSGASTGIGSGYAFNVDLTGGLEFCLPDGRFGYGIMADEPPDPQDGFASTGPILCFAGDGAGGPEPATGLFDAFDSWVPDTKGVSPGTFFAGGPPNNFVSWYLTLAKADLSGSPAASVTRDGAGNKPGSLICGPPVMGAVMDMTALAPGGYLATVFIAFDTAFNFTLGGGQTLLCIDGGGNGELFTGGGIAGTPGGTSGGCTIFTASALQPKNLDLCGATFCVQAIHAFGVTPFAMSSACDVVLGG